VIDLWYQLGSVATPALLIPLASSFSRRWRLAPRLALASIILSGGISFLWLLAGWHGGGVFLGIEAIYPGMAVAVGIWGVGRMVT
jgi:hypothetical protein